MRCPNCNTEISLLDIAMGPHYETDGLQIVFECPGFDKTFFAILTPKTFIEAD